MRKGRETLRVVNFARSAATGLALLALAFALLPAAPAAAVTGYDASYFSESAFPSIAPGQGAQLAVGFTNSGTVSWAKGTATQVNLSICAQDKVTCNTTSGNASFNDAWFSNIAYATTSIAVVGPGQTGYFIYNVKAPAGAAVGNYRFNGDLVLGLTGEKIHAVGYYQDVLVTASNVSSLSIAPTQTTLNPGQQVQFQATAKDANGNVVASQPGWSATGGTISNTGLYTAGSASGSYTVTASLGSSTATATVAIFIPGQLNLALSQPGTFTLVLTSGVPLDPATIVSTNFSWDSATFPTTPTQSTGGTTCSTTGTNCREVRLDFNSSALPVAGVHTLDVFNVKDMSGNLISPNPTSFRVTIPNDGIHPKVMGVTVIDNLTLDVDYSESMKSNAIYPTQQIDNVTNYRLLNRDGSQATTTGQNGTGTTIAVSAAVTGGTSTTDQIFNLTRARLTISGALGTGQYYYLLPQFVADEASNLIDPNPTAVLFVNSTSSTRPTLASVSAGTDQNSITINYSKPMSHQATAGAGATSCGGGGVQIDNRSNYTSLLVDNVTISQLGTAINNANTCYISPDEQTVTLTWDPSFQVQPGTYKLTVTGVNDKQSNVINPNPTDTTVTYTDTTAPTITSVIYGGTTSLTINYSETVRGGATQPDSAGNPQSYSINSLAAGNLCTGTTTIQSSNNGKTWIIQCGTSGTWGTQNTNTLHVMNVKDQAGNTIVPVARSF